ncbi:carboxylating nicotinate-nucleotide diphosphorylase [Mastigocoleus testarum]|uniref:Probable nicotinate-nucleotide pyrophosphorylase [carboxylating] n=1 Tax=Mastigocoleus testarum BC008 TaxID=371196 RepID=A0A0V7ZZH9_9CYAN|nr:carboxylating nicotinate-nucleotide diphosphorylase [Mastigocoleus testarum]KST69851.1 nicotinate-nucleotide pyrophosphorylase [Mastigocoleus testarum BC008]
MRTSNAVLPPNLLLNDYLKAWLQEDIGRGDRTTQSLLAENTVTGQAQWIAKADGVIAGLPIAARVFQLLNEKVSFTPLVKEGEYCKSGTAIAKIEGSLDALLTGERVALNLAMRLSGIASLTYIYVEKIADLPTNFVDTRKTTPGLRILEKYATQVGGAINHRMGLDDAVMIKDNHIAAAGGIGKAITCIRSRIPYPLMIEVETENLDQVKEAIEYKADIIMLDNMPVNLMKQAVQMIRDFSYCNARGERIKIEASGNINLDTIRSVAETGVDYISSSAPITQSKWLDLSMRIS